MVYFAKKFLDSPEATLSVIKVISTIAFLNSPDFHSQTQFQTTKESLTAWGLEDSNLSFIRREMRSLLLKYIMQKDAVVEYH